MTYNVTEVDYQATIEAAWTVPLINSPGYPAYNQRSVIIALAHHWLLKGDSPSLDEIRWCAGQSKAVVHKTLKKLEALGRIRIERVADRLDRYIPNWPGAALRQS